MPSLVLTAPDKYTLPLFQYKFKGTHDTHYSLVFASFFMAMIPIMILYMFMHKYIIGGIISGAVKG